MQEIIIRLEDNQEDIFITTINIMELWMGAMLSKNKEKNINQINKLIECFNIYSFDLDSSKVAGEINAFLRDIGKKIDLEDVMISAIAKTKNEKVLTRNIKHFSLVPNLQIETY